MSLFPPKIYSDTPAKRCNFLRIHRYRDEAETSLGAYRDDLNFHLTFDDACTCRYAITHSRNPVVNEVRRYRRRTLQGSFVLYS